MLLISQISRRLRRDDGSVLIPVIVVMAVGLIVGGLLSTSVVGGMTYSTSARAGVQSQASADAGVAAALAGLYAGNCTLQSTPGVYKSTGAITYSATIQRLNPAWESGCPAYLTPQVKIVSTGRAVDTSGNPSGASTTVEAIYNFLWPGVVPSGVGVYLYGGLDFSANSSFDLKQGSLVVKNGNLVCSKNNSVINGSIIVNGNLDLGGNSCTISGDASVSGLANLGSKGSVTGNLTSGSVNPNPPGSQVGKTYAQSSTLPSTPPWTDVPYTPTDWVDSLGIPYQVVTLSGSSCTQSGGLFGGSAGQPVIINALACPSGIQVSNNTTFQLTSDVAIFAPMFSWGSINSLNFASSDATQHRVWFVTPDTLTSNPTKPDCQAGQGDFAINNGFQIQANINAMVYTPCSFSGKNGFTWRGQIYAGNYSYLNNNPSLTASLVGIAGYDLGSGTKTNTVTTPQPGSLVSNRNIVP